MDIHFVREKVARGQVRVLHVPSKYQIADIFTKGFHAYSSMDSGTVSVYDNLPLQLWGCVRRCK